MRPLIFVAMRAFLIACIIVSPFLAIWAMNYVFGVGEEIKPFNARTTEGYEAYDAAHAATALDWEKVK